MTHDEWDALFDELADRAGWTSDERAEWREAEAESARQTEAERARLAADLAEHPDSSTLSRLAVLDPSGAVMGRTSTGSITETAWESGAPAALIAEADRALAILDASGRPGSHRWLRTALRLAWWLRSLNRRLRPYTGRRRSLDTASHRDSVSLTDRLALGARAARITHAAEALASSPTSAPAATGPPGSTSLPILEPSTVAPLLRTGPPLALERGPDRLPCWRTPLVAYGGDGRAA